MTHILFIHSAGAQGPGEGSSRLLEALRDALPHGWTLDAPPMPEPDAPDALRWIAAVRASMADTSGPFVALGHSLGGSTILQALARHGIPETLLGVVGLATPYWGAPDWDYDSYALPPDAGTRLRDLRLVLLQGNADNVVAADHPDRYRATLPQVEIRVLPGIDHEAADAAPEVIDAIRSITPA